MRDAVNELTRCRVTLKWTYAMAYFLEAGNKKQIFEDIQAYVTCSTVHVSTLTLFTSSDLEKAVEDLSQLLDEPVDEDSVKSLRQRMLDKTVCLFFSPPLFNFVNFALSSRFMSAGDTTSCCRTLQKGLPTAAGSGANRSTEQILT